MDIETSGFLTEIFNWVLGVVAASTAWLAKLVIVNSREIEVMKQRLSNFEATLLRQEELSQKAAEDMTDAIRKLVKTTNKMEVTFAAFAEAQKNAIEKVNRLEAHFDKKS